MMGRLPNHVDDVRKATDEEWNRFFKETPYATFFHSPAWSRVWSIYRDDMEPSPRLVRFDEGTEALLPLTIAKRWGGTVRAHISSPAGTYGGWLAPSSLDASQREAIEQVIVGLGEVKWRVNPFAPSPSQSLLEKAQDDFTQALHLSSPFDKILDGWSKSRRYNARKAEREGVKVSTAESRSEWEEYFEAYEDSLERWGEDASSRYHWPLFEALRAEEEGVELWVSRFDGRVVSGALCLYAGNHVAYWHGATLREYFDVNPVDILFREAIRDACDRGLEWFDFNPSGGHEGVVKFKKRFGPERLPAPMIKQDSLTSHAISLARDLLP